MQVKALIVVMSHLSDAQMLMDNAGNREAQHRINFAKYICLQVVDLSTEINPDAMYEEFLKLKTK